MPVTTMERVSTRLILAAFGWSTFTSMSATAALDATEVELTIGGMTCAACAARVQAKLNKVDGVTATVNRYAGSVEQASEHAVAAAVTALAVAESASLASAAHRDARRRTGRKVRPRRHRRCRRGGRRYPSR